MFRLEVLPARYGDCLWIEYGDAAAPRRILIDGARELLRAIEARVKIREVFVCERLCQSEDQRRLLDALPDSGAEVLDVAKPVFDTGKHVDTRSCNGWIGPVRILDHVRHAEGDRVTGEDRARAVIRQNVLGHIRTRIPRRTPILGKVVLEEIYMTDGPLGPLTVDANETDLVK